MSCSPTHCSRSATLRPGAPPPQAAAGAAREGDSRRRRSLSNSSASSAGSATSSTSEDQFVFSPQRSPPRSDASFFPSARGTSSQISTAGQAGVDNSPRTLRKIPEDSPQPRASPTPYSKPIAIELPPSVSRKIASSSVYTPIEPLSGRGDISGGYFPFHEDPDKRVHRPHPFHEHAERVKGTSQSWQEPHRSSEPSKTTAQRPALREPAVSEPQGLYPKMNSAKMSTSRGTTPVTSYVPSGLHDVPLPVGKYYPSNYEAARSRQNDNQNARPSSSRSGVRPPSSAGPSSIKSDTVVPQFNRGDSSRGRSDSDAKRRLQQYQRDMVAQATQAARHLARTESASASLAAVHGAPLQKFHTSTTRPISPRLQPLGSPGPVTPMELEGQGGDGGYLTRGRPVPSPDAGRESQAVARALRHQDERRRREGRSSPAVEAGGFGF